MKVTLEKKEKNQVELAVEIEKETVEKAYERAYREISQHVNIPGFRRGKAPRQLIERHVGEETVRHEAEKTLAGDSYNKAIEEAQVEPIAQPHYEVITLAKGQPATFKYTVEVRPDVTLGSYTDLKVSVPREQLKDEDVTKTLDNLRT
ncbi:MAG: trigger factor, partial [Cyanobacteria bacterium REEB65]|nr:trigger factor [Cyanobacteria bacterium REEB65]